jgi:hypothetical protein
LRGSTDNCYSDIAIRGTVMRLAFGVLLLSSMTLAQVLPSLSAVEDLALRDQYGVEDTLRAHRGRVVVIMVVDAKRLRTLKAWERDLRESFDDLDYLRIAEVPTDTSTTWERVASKLVEQVPEGVSVLIDMDSRWGTELALDTSRPNLIVVDAGGRIRATYAGRHEPALAAVVISDLEKLVAGP